jgi:hypothetical protein
VANARLRLELRRDDALSPLDCQDMTIIPGRRCGQQASFRSGSGQIPGDRIADPMLPP